VCKCVLYYCHRVATQLQLNISYHISYIKILKLYISALQLTSTVRFFVTTVMSLFSYTFICVYIICVVCTYGRQGSRPAAAHGVSRTHNNHCTASKITNKCRPHKTNKIQVLTRTAKCPTTNFQLQIAIPALYSITDIRTQKNARRASDSQLCEMPSEWGDFFSMVQTPYMSSRRA
jgi:hypothetical protein